MRHLLLAIALVGCRYTGEFPCMTTAQCVNGDTAGTCELAGYCSLPDDECVSGRRYDSSASADLADTCVPGPDGCEMWATHYLPACRVPPPQGNFTIAVPHTLDTTDGAFEDFNDVAVPLSSVVLDIGGIPTRVVSVQDMQIGAMALLRVRGDKPLMIFAWGSIVIDGILDASSRESGAIGPGANPSLCAATASTAGGDATDTGGGGGGGGGAFGGDGGGGATGVGAGGMGGAQVPVPMQLRGGCPGSPSGRAGPTAMIPATPDSVGEGGPGGGAIMLAARTSIRIGGELRAGGAGGKGSPMGAASGGGGAGSGGMIVLDSPSVQISGPVEAHGGGGGGGGGTAATLVGRDGADGGDGGALGGAANACAGAGGEGSSSGDLSGDNAAVAMTVCGGGGGGGGAGYTIVFGAEYTATLGVVSPMAIRNPF